ncbi:peptidoglycan DD-metalloendopeptidase family protein [Georgenia subflava]|uniref:Peptidoglycan DD-metalloendopeptidase family protein n=1 Tax=Georgenia subflava TaxID=1622177 RepID=A0A6N7EER4_9MICO|nr:M23 family metallopeptidase [Georgenia subflava]MPV35851.1 peptidoglycan DD-metalloendopeptidase family protein [Georgenia subflava]
MPEAETERLAPVAGTLTRRQIREEAADRTAGRLGTRLGRPVRATLLAALGVATVAAPLLGLASSQESAQAVPEVTPLATSALDTLEQALTSAGIAATQSASPLAATPLAGSRAEIRSASRANEREALPEEAVEGADGAAAAVADPAPEVVMPLAAGTYRSTSPYGVRADPFGRGRSMHTGTDMAAPLGTPIHAVADGVVTYVGDGKDGRSPTLVTIKHEVDGEHFESWYNHMYPGDVHVSVGQKVSAGDVIAAVGSNGNSTGPHLHFEIHTDDDLTTTEPLAWMAGLDAVDVSEL